MLICGCDFKIVGHEFWSAPLSPAKSSIFKIDPPMAMPKHLIIALRTSKGFAEMGEALDYYKGYDSWIVFTDPNGLDVRHHLAVLEENDAPVGVCGNLRSDGGFDMAWRLRSGVERVASVKIQIEKRAELNAGAELILKSEP